MKKEFLISVIIPIYNTEEYIGEAIDSVINQSIGFEENIQLILINDGSTDNSEEICKEYQKQYPDNIIYKKKKNGGVSSARNEGRKYVKGKYFNFLDSDDKWDSNAFEYAYNFFEQHYDEIDVVNTRTIIFGDKEYSHPLDHKFDDGTRIVDLREDYDCIQLGNAACFFKTEAFDDLLHNINLITAEDLLFIGTALLKKMKYGLLKESIYYYRRLNNSNNLSSNCMNKKSWYFDVLSECHVSLIEQSKKIYKNVPSFIQYMLLYELQWRMYKNKAIDELLTEKEKCKYKELIVSILKNVDDDIILSLKGRGELFKIYLLKLKYNGNVLEDCKIEENRYLYFKDNLITDIRAKSHGSLTLINTENENLVLEGKCSFLTDIVYESNKYNLCVKDDNNKIYECKLNRLEYLDKLSFVDDFIIEGLSFKAEIPLKSFKTLEFCLIDKQKREFPLKISLGKHSRLTSLMRNTYCTIEDIYILKFFGNKLRKYKYTKITHIASELRYIKELIIKKREFKVVFDRINYYIMRLFHKKPIWIVRDRYEKAGDNGESVFKYLSTWKDKDKYNIYFLLRKDSSDYQRIKEYGKVIDPRSKKYKRLFLLSSKIIDSIVTSSSINPFDKKGCYYRDLFNFDFIALFHGIGQRDMSAWTNKFNYNIKLYVSGAKKEYEAMLTENNGYDKEIIKLTGLPRFDELRKNDKKMIVFMPTWRADIAAPLIPGTNQRKFVSDFTNTEYFKFYNSLINNKQLLNEMKKYGYHGIFYNHPNFAKQADDFTSNDIITVSKKSANANEVISDCSMLVTDYSSAFFECAYLEKPVVYTQFDYKDFVKRHTGTKGYFDYDKDSFGPVCHDLDSSVNAIINYIKKDCKIESKYKRRIDSFFVFKDKKNCQRLVNEIVNLDRNKEKKIKKMEESR